MVYFGKKIAEMRIAKGKTQQELANFLGVDVKKIGRIERGETRSIKNNDLQKIALFFNVSLDFLIDQNVSKLSVSQEKNVSKLSVSQEKNVHKLSISQENNVHKLSISQKVPQNECVSECVSPSSDPNSYYNIPKLTLHAQAGGGNELLDLCCYESGETLTIDKAFFKSIPQHKLKAIKVEGYSMIPMLYPDSWVIFEESREFKGDGLYIINYANQLMVKLLQLDPARNILDIISANKDYKSYSISESQIEFIVIGKVLRCII